MKGKNIMSLSLILMFITVIMMNIRTVQAGPYEYELYVEDFKPWVSQWAWVGDSPWLDAVGDNNFIEGTFDGAWMANFTFEDINLPPCQVITKVVLEGYTNGTYNPKVDFDVYTLPDFVWLGSLYATGAPAWVTPRWVGTSNASDLEPSLKTEAGINDLEVLVYFYDPYDSGGTGNTIDALRLKVYTAISATIDIDPDIVKLSNNAKYLTCYIEPCTAFSATDIDPSTVKLDGIPALPHPPPDIDDNIPPPPNPNGIPDLTVKFNQTEVKLYIVDVLLNGIPPIPGNPVDVTLTISGSLYTGELFTGNCTIEVKA